MNNFLTKFLFIALTLVMVSCQDEPVNDEYLETKSDSSEEAETDTVRTDQYLNTAPLMCANLEIHFVNESGDDLKLGMELMDEPFDSISDRKYYRLRDKQYYSADNKYIGPALTDKPMRCVAVCDDGTEYFMIIIGIFMNQEYADNSHTIGSRSLFWFLKDYSATIQSHLTYDLKSGIDCPGVTFMDTDYPAVRVDREPCATYYHEHPTYEVYITLPEAE